MLAWLSRIGVDFIGRVPTNVRRVDFRQGRCLGRYDRVVGWHKRPPPRQRLERSGLGRSVGDGRKCGSCAPRNAAKGLSFARNHLGHHALGRAELYSAEELLAAYARRWRLELCLDDLKTTLGLETLKCLSPTMAQKELLVGLIAHNLLRCVMAEAAKTQEVTLERISFKGALDALRQFNYAMCQTRSAHRKKKLWAALLLAMARDLVPERPGRREPRAVKRRPKYDHLNRPRAQYHDRPRRSVRRSIAKKNRLI